MIVRVERAFSYFSISLKNTEQPIDQSDPDGHLRHGVHLDLKYVKNSDDGFGYRERRHDWRTCRNQAQCEESDLPILCCVLQVETEQQSLDESETTSQDEVASFVLRDADQDHRDEENRHHQYNKTDVDGFSRFCVVLPTDRERDHEAN